MKAVRGFLLILITILSNFAASSAQTSQNPTNGTIPNSKSDNQDELYRIGYQDTLEVQVFKHPELSQRASVNPDGTITLFRASKPIVAICKTEREVAKEVENEYISFLKKPEVNVLAVEKKSQSYGVIGAVEKPAKYYGVSRIRLLDLLSLAGGPNKEAGSRMIVARTGSSSACKMKDDNNLDDDLVVMNFKVRDVLEAKQNLWMQPGDIVSVMDADEVYVYGNVNKVGSVKMKEPITLTQAIVSAEGLKPTAKSQIRVLRQKTGSADREELLYDLKDIEKRKVQDPFLEPNDIVAVSEDSSKAIMRGIVKTFQQGIPSLFYKVP
jgi:polysaccharide export outer membrane protein